MACGIQPVDTTSAPRTRYQAGFALGCTVAIALAGACSSSGSSPGSAGNVGAATGAASGALGASSGVATGNASGGSGNAQPGETGAARGAGVSAGENGVAPSGADASAGSMATSGSGDASSAPDAANNYAPAPRPINVQGTGVFSNSYMGQPMYLDKSKPIQGKLVLFLGGVCTGVGGGGFEAFVEEYGFHVFEPKTDTCLDGGKVPASYETTLMTSPMDPEANRQIGDSRMDLWDGTQRVDWYTVPAGASLVDETVAAIKYAMSGADVGGDWGYFLDPTGTSLRTSDVWVVGYSWGSQTWAMISAYVPFGRVVTTSGPQDEGFPNALWITQPGPNATPGDRKYMLAGFTDPYPSTAADDAEVMSMVSTVTRAGWDGTATNVLPNGMGTYTASQHLFAMVGGNGGISPGGHTVFCNNNPMNGWLPLCRYVMSVP
jgi:hypothetical protein